MLCVSNGPGNGPHNPSMGRVLSEADLKMLAGIRQKRCWLIVSCIVVAMFGFCARTTWDGIKEGLGHERLEVR